MNSNNGSQAAPVDPARSQIQEAVIEACFWKQKYFELLTHSNQVIAMLSRPQVTPEQLSALVSAAAAQRPESAANDAQNDAQPRQSAPQSP